MKIMTCNIRCSVAEDGDNNWENRKDLCAEVIKSREPSIICFQEMWHDQFIFMREALDGFSHVGMADAPCGVNPVNSVFYKDEFYELISSGGNWLSETPHIPGSSSWDSAYVRLVNWVCLIDRKSSKQFRVVNTHLDNISQQARENQAALINQSIAPFPEEYPQVLTGDMNCNSSNKVIHMYREAGWIDSYERIHGADNPCNTIHDFLGDRSESDIGKIDWIFVKGKLKICDAEIVRDSDAHRYPSDHYFVLAEVML